MKKIITLMLVCCFTAFLALPAQAGKVFGTLDLTDYNDSMHDIKGNTLALTVEKDNGTITSCTLVVFDKKANEKINLAFDDAIGYDKIAIVHFDKTWAVIQCEGDEDIYYSLKLKKKGISILGSILDTEFRFRFASGKYLVSALNDTAQLYNDKFEKIGSSLDLIGNPRSLNDGKYFYCEGGNETEIYKVKNGFELVLSETGDYREINEDKRMCCIRDDDTHKICKY